MSPILTGRSPGAGDLTATCRTLPRILVDATSPVDLVVPRLLVLAYQPHAGAGHDGLRRGVGMGRVPADAPDLQRPGQPEQPAQRLGRVAAPARRRDHSVADGHRARRIGRTVESQSADDDPVRAVDDL